MENITLDVQLFGELKSFSQNQTVKITLPQGGDIKLLRQAIINQHPVHDQTKFINILNHCAFATETTILDSTAIFENDMKIAVLPPVCGG